MRVILVPHLSEKSSVLATKKQYVFFVPSNATKDDVRESVEHHFAGTKVSKVRVVNLPKKSRFFRRQKGKVSRPKKAIVTLASGSITIMEGVNSN